MSLDYNQWPQGRVLHPPSQVPALFDSRGYAQPPVKSVRSSEPMEQFNLTQTDAHPA